MYVCMYVYVCIYVCMYVCVYIIHIYMVWHSYRNKETQHPWNVYVAMYVCMHNTDRRLEKLDYD